MSLNVTNRLDKLENEIRVMLMLQKCGGKLFSQGTTVTTTPDDNIKGVEICTKTQPRRSCYNANTRRLNRKIPYPIKCTIECSKKSTRPSSATDESGTRHSSPTGSSIKSDPVGCICKRPKIQMNTMAEGPTTRVCLCRPPPVKRICKCSVNELDLEREKRKKLEEEVEKLKRQISEIMQSKCLAVTMTQQLRRKYDKFRGLHGQTVNKLSEMSKEKEYLCKCLEHERARNARKYFTGEAGVQVGYMRRGRLDTLQEQEEEIKTLNNSLISLTKSVQEKEMENRKLQIDKQQLAGKLQVQMDVNKQLADTNGRLANSVKQKHDSFMVLRTKAGKIRKDVKGYKEEARRSRMEIEHLKEELQKQQQLKDKTPKITTEALEVKLKKTKDRERRASETIQLLNQKLRDMQNKENAFKQKEQEFQKILKAQKTLQAKYDEVVQKLVEYEEAEKIRTEYIQSEMRNISDGLEQGQMLLGTEKDELKALIGELNEIVNQQKTRIYELQSVIERQEMVIRSQTESITSHEEQVSLAEREAEMMKQKYSSLDNQLEKMKASFGDDFGASGERLVEKILNMNQELKEVRLILDDERAKGAIKDKLIDDQYATIEDLKKTIKSKENELKSAREEVRRSLQEVEKSREELARITRALEREEAMKRTLVSDLTNMQRHRDVFEKKMSLLETTVAKLSLTGETGPEIESLKGGFEVQKQEWDVERIELLMERDRAIETAKYATRTFVEAMDEFQEYVKSQQKMRRIITDLITDVDKDKLASCMKSAYDPKQTAITRIKRHETQFQQDFTGIHDKQIYCPGTMRYQTYPDEERYYSAHSSEHSQQQADAYSWQHQQPTQPPHYGIPYSQPYLYRCPNKCTHRARSSSPSCYCGMTPCCCIHKHKR